MNDTVIARSAPCDEAIPNFVGDCSPALQQTQCGASVGRNAIARSPRNDERQAI